MRNAIAISMIVSIGLFGCSDGEVIGGPTVMDSVALADLDAPGDVLFNLYHFTEDVTSKGIELGDTVWVAAMFPQPRVIGNAGLSWDHNCESITVDSCRVVYHDTGTDPWGISRVELDADSLGREIMMFQHIPIQGPLTPDFSGYLPMCQMVETDSQSVSYMKGQWRTLTFDTQKGPLSVIPDTTAYLSTHLGLWRGPVEADVYAEFGGKRSRLKIAARITQYHFIDVVWVGDLDGDTVPDLIMDYGYHGGYNVYLSTLAVGDDLYGLAAKSDYAYD